MSLDLRGPVEESLRRSAHQRAVDANTTPLRVWNWIWPKLLAVGLVILIWQSGTARARVLRPPCWDRRCASEADPR